MIDQLKPLIGKLTIFAKKRMGFEHPPRLFLRSDSENSQKMLGKTAYYDPQEKAVTLFTHNRHPKDILRSYAHELVHHTQNLRGDLSPEKCGEMGQGYAQANGHMREMEREAYEKGNMCFRDWEDTLNDKDTYIIIKIAESKNLKENKSMTTKITKELLKETIRKILSEFTKSDALKAVEGDKQAKARLRLKKDKAAAIEKAKNPWGPDYDQLVGAAGAAMKADRDKAMAAVAKQFDAQIAAVGNSDALDIDTAMASNMPSPGVGAGAKSFDDVLGGYNAEPAAAAKPAAKKMSRRQLIRKRAGQQERALKRIKPYMMEKISDLQRTLIYLGYLAPKQDNGKPSDDGKYGEQTMNAVKELQKAAGMPISKRDGVIGNETLRSIDVNGELDKKLKASEQEAKTAGLPGAGSEDGDLSKLNLSGAKLPAGLDENEELEEGGCGSHKRDELEENEELEEGGKYDDKDGKDEKCDYVPCKESKIQTPEQEDSLYESRFAERNNRLFENLSKKWTK